MKRSLVFVDPDDVQVPFWWPAMVVSASDWKEFRKSFGGFRKPQSDEFLVCYFEDASFSTVKKQDTRPFSPLLKPYSEWSSIEGFATDAAVCAATLYWESLVVPASFAWLNIATSSSPSSIVATASGGGNGHNSDKSDKSDKSPKRIKIDNIEQVPPLLVASASGSSPDQSESDHEDKPMSKKRRWISMWQQSLA